MRPTEFQKLLKMASKIGFKLTFWPAMSDTIFFWDISKKS